MNKKRFSNEKKGLVFFSFLLLFIFMIGVTSAAIDTNDVDDVFKVNDRITYAKPCINNGTFCSSTAVCNFSFFDPNNQVIVDNEQGDNQVSRHEINVTLNTIGVWKVDMVCHDGDRQGAETYFAQVSGGGFNDSLGFLVIIALFSFGVITLGFYLPDGWITILGTFGLYFLGLFILFNGISGLKDPTTTWGTGIIILSVAMYISVKSAHEMITN